MIVFGSTLSPYVRKCMVFAAEKGLDVELKGTRDPAAAEEFRAISPFGKMPAFRDGDFAIADSSAIVTYLDTIRPEPNLIPTEAKARARTIWFEEFADTIVMDSAGKVFFHRVVGPRFFGQPGDPAIADEAEKIGVRRALDYLESVIPASGFLVEDRFTLADIAVASPFASLRYADWECDAGRHPKTRAYLDAILARPSFAVWIAREKKALAPA